MNAIKQNKFIIKTYLEKKVSYIPALVKEKVNIYYKYMIFYLQSLTQVTSVF